MRIHEFHAELWLPRPRAEVFAFFSRAENLEAITPGWLHFKVLTAPPIQLRSGALIDYRLRVHGIPFRWQTEITVWEPPVRFADVQRRGPYRRWEHTHTFIEERGGTLCRDHVIYAVAGPACIERWFVRPDVKRIFAHREKTLRRLLG